MTATENKARALTHKSAEVALATQQVLAHRLARMALAGPVLNARDRQEFTGMMLEKQVAFFQSWLLMTQESLRLQHSLTLSIAESFFKQAFNATHTPQALAEQFRNASLGVMEKGLEPVHRKVMANAKRLSTTKLR